MVRIALSFCGELIVWIGAIDPLRVRKNGLRSKAHLGCIKYEQTLRPTMLVGTKMRYAHGGSWDGSSAQSELADRLIGLLTKQAESRTAEKNTEGEVNLKPDQARPDESNQERLYDELHITLGHACPP